MTRIRPYVIGILIMITLISMISSSNINADIEQSPELLNRNQYYSSSGGYAIAIFTYAGMKNNRYYEYLCMDPNDPSLNEREIVTRWIHTFIKQYYPGIYGFLIRHGYIINTTRDEIVSKTSKIMISITYTIYAGNVDSYLIIVRADNTNNLNKIIGPNARDVMELVKNTVTKLIMMNGSMVNIVKFTNRTTYSYYWNNTIRGFSRNIVAKVKVNDKYVYYVSEPHTPSYLEEYMPYKYPKGFITATPLRFAVMLEYDPGEPAEFTIMDWLSYPVDILIQHMNDFNNISWPYNREEVTRIFIDILGRRINDSRLTIEYAYGLRGDKLIPIILARYNNNNSETYSLLITCDDGKYYFMKWPPLGQKLEAYIGSMESLRANESNSKTALNTNIGNDTSIKSISDSGRSINRSVDEYNSQVMLEELALVISTVTILVLGYYLVVQKKKH